MTEREPVFVIEFDMILLIPFNSLQSDLLWTMLSNGVLFSWWLDVNSQVIIQDFVLGG